MLKHDDSQPFTAALPPEAVNSPRKNAEDAKREASMGTNDIMRLCDKVREAAYAIHVYHGNGYLEKVYENALVHRLRKAGLRAKPQHPITIQDEDSTVIGEYFADVMINDCLLIEFKACKSITNEHRSQVLHYLRLQVLSMVYSSISDPTDSRSRSSLGHKHSRQTMNESIFVFFAFFCGEMICVREWLLRAQ